MTAFWTDIYQSHFQKYFGKPFDIQVFHDPNGASLKLATHDWALQGFRVYASMGMADRLARAGEQAVGEVILYADVPDAEVPRLFVNALFFILQNEIPLTSRFSVGLGAAHPRFAARHGKSALYFTRAFSPDGQFNKVGNLARVYQAFFISSEEDELLEKSGPVEFEAQFWRQLGEEFNRDEGVQPPVDLNEMREFQRKTNGLWVQAAQLFRLARPSFV